jgi:group I intron endonuclease
MKPENYTLYRHISPTGKVYIGITRLDPNARWRNGHGYVNNKHFFNAIMKHGWDNFTHDILAHDLTKDEACAAEQEAIAFYRSNDPKYGYNNTTGGEHTTLSPESRRRMSEARSGERHFNYGKNFDAEHRRKLSESHRGEKNPNWGKPMSDEQKQKISAANRGRHRDSDACRRMSEVKRTKATPVLCVETGVVYTCLTEAAEAVGTYKSSISNCCNRRPHYNTAGGFHWRWASQD